MHENKNTVRAGSINAGAELKEDKVRLLVENKELRHKLDDEVGKNLVLSVTNVRLEETVIRLGEQVSRLEKEKQTLKTMKAYREYGILALTVLFGIPSLFTLTGWLQIIFGGVILCILCFACFTLFFNGNGNMDK